MLFQTTFSCSHAPMPDGDETMEELRKRFRVPMVAEIGGFRPPGDARSSWFGAGCIREGGMMPMADGGPMFPLLQINTAELPQAVPAFGPAKLVVVWISNAGVPFGRPHGDGWRIVMHESLDGLVPAQGPKPDHLKPQPVRWHVGEPERPGWEESWDHLDMTGINDSKEHWDVFFGLPHHYFTKIGGYASEVQHVVDQAADFVFQIGSEEKAQWQWVDSGVAYFSRGTDGKWKMEVQFY